MEVVLFVITITVACLLQAVIGFGSALLATPLALMYLDKETVVSSMLVVGPVLNGYLAVRIREQIDWKLVGLLLLASVVGAPLGLLVLKTISISLMKVVVGSLVVIFTAALYFGRFTLPNRRPLTVIAGVLSGLLNTSTSMGGPPVLLLLAGRDLPKNEFRRTVACLFFPLGLASVFLFVASRVMTLQRASFGLVSIPFVFLAGFAGDKIAARLRQRPFRLLALGTLFLAGLSSIVAGLGSASGG